ncbi:hypothetical protein RB653_001143 [Dictyostelium firmibasis]|uniref:3-oxo-5-alpha-steroid 4-dehydrogenase C-terminal domain-containing protein n=1 Tax=Dictyostelium firmibasis TaxID=79012 RepID=A0AAN7U7W4_9MYCE
MIIILKDFLIKFGYFISITFWIVSIFIYLLKIFNEDFGSFTSYGKLKFNLKILKEKKKKNKDNNNNNNNKNNNINITSILNLLFLDREIIDTKQAWLLFYTILLVLSNIFFFILSEKNIKSTVSTQILFILFFIQSGRRLYETHFIQKHRKSKMNLLLFISGLCYYLFLTLSAFTETLYKSNEENSINIFNLFLSILLFSIGSFEQYKSHEILSLIRSNSKIINNNSNNNNNNNNKIKSKNYIINKIIDVSDEDNDDDYIDQDINDKDFDDKIEYKTTSSTKYEIPNGRLYHYVSSPHYLSEILIYFSFLVLTNFKLNSLILNFIFTSLNLIHRSYQTHKWYKSKFSNYPKSRKAIIPFLF